MSENVRYPEKCQIGHGHFRTFSDVFGHFQESFFAMIQSNNQFKVTEFKCTIHYTTIIIQNTSRFYC